MRAIEKPRLRKEEKSSSCYEHFRRGSSLVNPESLKPKIESLEETCGKYQTARYDF